jgi:di/tricarboxylate transporter
MSPAVLSLIALLVAIGLSMTSRINVGIAALALAWIVGLTDPKLGADAVVKGFPVALFVALTGVTLLFAIADANGTLEGLARRAGRLARGDARLLAPMFFVIACALSAVGPGAISSVALVAPIAMAIGGRAGVPAFLTALMVANGANAGNFSPVSSLGVIANAKMQAAGVGGHPGKVMFANFAASLLVAAAAYVLLRGYKLPRATDEAVSIKLPQWTTPQMLTMAVTTLWIAGAVVLKWSLAGLGLAAIAAAAILMVFRTVDEAVAVKRVPWGVILMVCGVSTLVALLEATGGMELFTAMLSRLATTTTITGFIAFVTGAISIYSSTSGVVLPAFLPTVPGLVTRLGGGDPLAIALSINVGASLVDVSPLSTLGALCLAATSEPADARGLFRRLMIWGFAMAIVGALLCQLFAGVLARA